MIVSESQGFAGYFLLLPNVKKVLRLHILWLKTCINQKTVLYL